MLGGCPKYVELSGALVEKEGCNHATNEYIIEVNDVGWDVV